ncbi:MAG: hypothetical protein M3Z04_16280 [Chloroflexota bacterium]|nr:hypothetical protein [Chloroflexota bacterium]
MTRVSGSTFTEQPAVADLLEARRLVQEVLADDATNQEALRYRTWIDALIRDREEEYWQGLVAQAVESAFNGDFFAADHALARATLYPLSDLDTNKPQVQRDKWLTTGRILIRALRALAAGDPAEARRLIAHASPGTRSERSWVDKADQLIELADSDREYLAQVERQLQTDMGALTPQASGLAQLARSALPSGRSRPLDYPDNLHAARLRADLQTALDHQKPFTELSATQVQARRKGELVAADATIHQMRALMPAQYQVPLDTWAHGIDQIASLRQEARQMADAHRWGKAVALLDRVILLTPDDPTLPGLRAQWQKELTKQPPPALLRAGAVLAAVLLLGVGLLAGWAIFTPGGGTPPLTAVVAAATLPVVAPPITPTLTLTTEVTPPTTVALATAAATDTLVPSTATPVTPTVMSISPTEPIATIATSLSVTVTETPLTATLSVTVSPTPLFFVQIKSVAYIRGSVGATDPTSILATLNNPTILGVYEVKKDAKNIEWYRVTISSGNGADTERSGWVKSTTVTTVTPTPTKGPNGR